MAKLSLVSKIFLYLAILFFALFLGSYVARQMLIYQLFEPTGINFKSIYNEQNLSIVYSTIFPVLILNIVTYAIFLFSFIVFLIFSKIKIKYEGWLFAIIIIVVVTAPFEVYLLTIDNKIVQMIMSNSTTVTAISGLIKERMSVLSSFSLIEIFSSAAIIYLGLFKPLRKKNED